MHKNPRLLSSNNSRQVLDLSNLGLPEVPLMGMHAARSAELGLPSHQHPGNLEIVFLKKGRQIFNVGERDYPMRGGDLFLTQPDEIHGNGANPYGRCVLYWIQLRLPSQGEPFLLLPAEEADVLIGTLRTLPHRHFRGSSSIGPLFEKAFRLATAPPKNPLGKIQLALILVEWLLEVIACSETPAPASCSEDIDKILKIIEANPAANPSLEDMARQVYLSPSRFLAKFKEETGYTPKEFLLREKIGVAKKRLLEEKDRITTIAVELGFASSQHFATVFRKFEHTSPSQFRKNNK